LDHRLGHRRGRGASRRRTPAGDHRPGITRQARDITDALDGARSNTDALFDVTRTDLAIERITRGLHSVRTGGRQ